MIEAFLVWLEKQTSVRGSKFATAICYGLNHRNLMMTDLEDGCYSLSNNLSGQKMKFFVIGCKGWLFCDTPKRAEASAIAYSFAEMASANHLNVFKYIKYLLEQRPDESMEDTKLEELVP